VTNSEQTCCPEPATRTRPSLARKACAVTRDIFRRCGIRGNKLPAAPASLARRALSRRPQLDGENDDDRRPDAYRRVLGAGHANIQNTRVYTFLTARTREQGARKIFMRLPSY